MKKNNSGRRLLSLVLCLAMVASLFTMMAVTASAEEEVPELTTTSLDALNNAQGNADKLADNVDQAYQNVMEFYAQFKDLDANAWYNDAVVYVLNHGLMNGTSETTFEPNAYLTRGMVVTIFWRMENCPVVNYAMTFTDVAEDAWYAEAVRWAQSTGIVMGYDETTFGPDDYITREQFTTIMMRYAEYKGIDVSATTDLSIYIDADQISAWAEQGLQWLNSVGIMLGKQGNELAPDDITTRAEAAAMIERFLLWN